jgi:hypothetical protein
MDAYLASEGPLIAALHIPARYRPGRPPRAGADVVVAKVDAFNGAISGIDELLLSPLRPLEVSQDTLTTDPQSIKTRALRLTDQIAAARARLDQARLRVQPNSSDRDSQNNTATRKH